MEKTVSDNTLNRRSYSVPEAAVVAGSGTAMIYQGVKNGSIPHIRLGKKIILPREAFHRWLDSCGGKVNAA